MGLSILPQPTSKGDAVRMLDWILDRPLIFVVPFLVAAFAGLFYLMLLAAQAEREKCERDGGRILDKNTTAVGFTARRVNRHAAMRFCVTPDGRVLW